MEPSPGATTGTIDRQPLDGRAWPTWGWFREAFGWHRRVPAVHEVLNPERLVLSHPYRDRCIRIGREMLDTWPEGALDEQGVPAYVKGNPLSRWLFWKRLNCLADVISEQKGGECLDFGCGIGVMLPVLKQLFDTVHAVEISAEPTRHFLRLLADTTGESFDDIRLHESLESAGIDDHSLGLILAFDVLEHVEDLPGTLVRMRRLLRPDGILLVTGPTENWLYQLGRFLVGFSGHYHRRSIIDIERELARLFEIRIERRLVFPVDLFHVVSARPRL